MAHEVCHFLADTASEEQAVRATEVLAPQQACRQLFAEQPHTTGWVNCSFSCLLTQIPSLSATSKKLFRHMFVLGKTQLQGSPTKMMNCRYWGTSPLRSYSNIAREKKTLDRRVTKSWLLLRRHFWSWQKQSTISVIISNTVLVKKTFSKEITGSRLEQKSFFGWTWDSQCADSWRHRGCVQAQNTIAFPWDCIKEVSYGVRLSICQVICETNSHRFYLKRSTLPAGPIQTPYPSTAWSLDWFQ